MTIPKKITLQKLSWAAVLIQLCMGVTNIFVSLTIIRLILYTSWNYVGQSWQIMEGSREPGGLQGVYLLKSFIPLFAFLLGLQGISQSIKALAILNNISKNKEASAWK